MATITQYPDGVDVTGPTIDKVIPYPIDYGPEIFRNEDGGSDVNVQPCGVLRIDLVYSGLSFNDWNTIKDHYNLAKGKVNEFPFYCRTDDTTYTGMQYEKIEAPRHRKRWSKDLRVTLIKYV